MDETVDPCNLLRISILIIFYYFISFLLFIFFYQGEDFHRFACGSFIKNQRIPDDQSSFDVFDVLENKLVSRISGKFVIYLI